MDLSALRLFVRTAELGSISAAARELDWLPATASAALARAEIELGGKLFARTTRSLRPTPTGERFLEHARVALATLDEARELFVADRHGVTGLLRLSAPTDIGAQVVAGALDELLARHPGVSLALQLTDTLRDLTREDVDVALRYGTVRTGSLLARTLVETRRVLVASPAYLAAHGTPARVEDLAAHECLLLFPGGGVRRSDVWKLRRAGRAVEVRVAGRRSADSGATTRRWALAGQGIALKAWLDVCEDVDAGRLERVLPGVASEAYPLVLATSPGVRGAVRTRVLAELLAERLGARARQHPLAMR